MKITIKTAQKIARGVIRYARGGVDPRDIDFNDQINGHLAEVGLGWELKSGTYFDGVDCQFIGLLATAIRANAIEKYDPVTIAGIRFCEKCVVDGLNKAQTVDRFLSALNTFFDDSAIPVKLVTPRNVRLCLVPFKPKGE